VSNPLPINAVDITGYILLGTKKLNIHVTLEDGDSSRVATVLKDRGLDDEDIEEEDEGDTEDDRTDLDEDGPTDDYEHGDEAEAEDEGLAWIHRGKCSRWRVVTHECPSELGECGLPRSH